MITQFNENLIFVSFLDEVSLFGKFVVTDPWIFSNEVPSMSSFWSALGLYVRYGLRSHDYFRGVYLQNKLWNKLAELSEKYSGEEVKEGKKDR